jgi:hypothetical protein
LLFGLLVVTARYDPFGTGGLLSDELSKSQVDQLGERLRGGALSDEDLVLLDRFRRSYSGGYEAVIATVRTHLGYKPTGRPAKSTGSIVEKLRRETMRLSQMQDIAGCRFIVPTAVEQEEAIAKLTAALGEASVDDRRVRPSHGYRAVHVIAVVAGRPIEVQIRTILQHGWAELSEKYSDIVDPAIKYGGGPQESLSLLSAYSTLVAKFELLELNPGGSSIEDLDMLKHDIRYLMQTEIDSLEDPEGS